MAVPAVNRRGRSIEVRVLGSALRGAGGDPAGVILTMEDVDGGPPAPDGAAADASGPVGG